MPWGVEGGTGMADPDAWRELLMPEGPIIIGLDCAYVRNRGDKQKKFEVIIGKSVPEERDNRFFGRSGCSDRRVTLICIRKPEPAPSAARCTIYSPPGTQP